MDYTIDARQATLIIINYFYFYLILSRRSFINLQLLKLQALLLFFFFVYSLWLSLKYALSTLHPFTIHRTISRISHQLKTSSSPITPILLSTLFQFLFVYCLYLYFSLEMSASTSAASRIQISSLLNETHEISRNTQTKSMKDYQCDQCQKV